MTNHTKYNSKHLAGWSWGWWIRRWVDFAHLFLLTDLLDHEFQVLSGFINLGTQLHTKSNLKRWASLTLRRVLVKEPTTDQFRFTILRMSLLQIDSILQSREINLLHISSTFWTRRQTYRRISLVLLVWLVMNYLFMTQSHHDVTSLDIVMFFSLEINTFAHANVTVLVILWRASRCSCLDWLFWILHYLCKSHCVVLHSFVWVYLITSKSWVLST
jgi:hypothetical protein